MTDVLYLAWRYLRYNRGKTSVLVGSIALILFLPAGLQVVVGRAADMLTDRADRTPLLLGAAGSPVDLTLASLYFREPDLAPIPFREVDALNATGLATAIPLHLRFTAGGRRIVGTSLDYLDFRGLELADGRRFAVLGEAVLGARAAAALGAGVGDAVVSTPAGAFDVAGGFPLRMNVVGVLAPGRSPDDDAIFVDVKTAWIIAGVGHGHDDVATIDDDEQILERGDGAVVASPALLPYTEITPENLASFHFHGDPATFPLDAAVVVPRDARSGIVLRGRYAEAGAAAVQLVVPRAVVDDLVATMFSVRDAALLVGLGFALATAAACALVFALSIRLRRSEIETMRRIGAARGRVTAVLAAEVLGIVLAAVLIAGAMTAAVSRFGGAVLRLVAG